MPHHYFAIFVRKGKHGIVNQLTFYHLNDKHLQSSPTGPAEHCAGGSRPKSCNSCNGKRKDVLTNYNTAIIKTFHYFTGDTKCARDNQIQTNKKDFQHIF